MYSALGYWLIEQKRIGCAVPAFRSGVKLAPGSFEARLNPGDDNARGALGEVEKEIAQGAARHFQRSSQLIQAGRRAEAIAELQSAIRMKPDYAEALRLAPDLAAAHLIQGRALYDLKHYEEARAALGQALRLAPGDPQALYRLGLAEARLNHPARTGGTDEQGSGSGARQRDGAPGTGPGVAGVGGGAERLGHLRRAAKLDPANSQAAYALLRAPTEGSGKASQLGQRVRELKREELSATQARALSDFALDAAKE